ncbi:MAG: acyl carrier protein [Desulfomonilaceae bacterium]
MSDSVFQAIISVISKRFVFEGELTPETRFIEDIGADSLDIIQLADDMEKNFQITITLDDLGKIRTIADVVSYIENHRRS